jgi:hypothetical protein
MFTVVFIILLAASILSMIEFLSYLSNGRLFFRGIPRIVYQAIIVAGFPLLYFFVIDEPVNNCCTDSATFAPDHKLSIYVYVIVCVLVYFYSTVRKVIATPLLEVITNCILLLGIVLNVFVAIQINNPLWVLGNLPIGIMFLYELIKNQKMIMEQEALSEIETLPIEMRVLTEIMKGRIFYKFPILLVLCIPLTILISCILLLFGQQPDSIVRVFTETYKHGFSQLDYLCKNVECGGHFLCSVAAKGHKKIVKPIRYGERGGQKIICNRQLLVANAFEELIQEKFPKVHKVIRRNYNKIGSFIHKYYRVFNLKIVADAVYVFMKPLELVFLLVLYVADREPENRIAKQYLSLSHKQILAGGKQMK